MSSSTCLFQAVWISDFFLNQKPAKPHHQNFRDTQSKLTLRIPVWCHSVAQDVVPMQWRHSTQKQASCGDNHTVSTNCNNKVVPVPTTATTKNCTHLYQQCKYNLQSKSTWKQEAVQRSQISRNRLAHQRMNDSLVPGTLFCAKQYTQSTAETQNACRSKCWVQQLRQCVNHFVLRQGMQWGSTEI